MKIIAKPVKTIAVFDYDGTITPCKFKYKKSMDEEKEVVVENILFSERHKIAGVDSIMYRCENYVENQNILYELKYLQNQCRWILYRI